MYFTALAAVLPFLALYYKSIGLSGGEMGFLLALSPLVSPFAGPFWTGLADSRHWHKPILLATILLLAVFMSAFPFVHSVLLLIPVVSLYAFFGAPVIPLVDNATLLMLGEDRDRYGRVRLWGTIGWGLAAPIFGALLQRQGMRWAFWIYAAVMLLALFPSSRLVFHRVNAVTPFRQGVRKLFSNRTWVFFLMMVFVAGIGLSVSNTYLAVLMDSLGGTKTMTGWALTVSTISELPVMFFSYVLLRSLKPRGLFLLAITASGFRCILYALIPSPVGIVAVQLMHGLTYGAMWISGVTYAAENAPAGLGATAQAIFGSTLMGLGSAAGSWLGGVLISRFQPAGMYGLIGAGTLAGLLLFLFIERTFLAARAEQPTS